MAATHTRREGTPLDAAAIRNDFPILRRPVEPGRRPLAFLDSAASSQKPAVVIEAMDDFYRRTNANIHRGVYQLSELATARYEEARHVVAAFIDAPSQRECIFVRNTTEAINLVASSWGRTHLKRGDVVLLSVMEHHSNLVPWHMLRDEIGIEIAYIPLTDDQRLDMDAAARLIAERAPKLVAVSHVSNTLGTVNDVATLAKLAHNAGALILVDAAQSAPHLPISVQDLDVDFLAFSGHKMLGPLGSGVLWGRERLLDAMPPYMGGGSMIRKVTLEGTTYADIPARFEAGTPAVADAVGLAAAIQYLEKIGMDRVREHELDLLAYAMERLATVPGIVQYGPRDLALRSGVVSFTLGDVHPHDIAAILDSENVAVRAGHHCTQPLMAELGVVATTRASFYVYSTRADVDQLVGALHKVNRIFGVA
jgi:cysteine desulfurase / selenocysteine lyase